MVKWYRRLQEHRITWRASLRVYSHSGLLVKTASRDYEDIQVPLTKGFMYCIRVLGANLTHRGIRWSPARVKPTNL